MNVLMLLKPKSEINYLIDTYSMRQGLEQMRAHGYSATPVITREGKYVGSVREGDFLWKILENAKVIDNIKKCEQYSIRELIEPGYNPAVNIGVTMDELIERAANQNFIPVVDDRGYFIGIVTRKNIIKTFCDYDNYLYLKKLTANAKSQVSE